MLHTDTDTQYRIFLIGLPRLRISKEKTNRENISNQEVGVTVKTFDSHWKAVQINVDSIDFSKKQQKLTPQIQYVFHTYSGPNNRYRRVLLHP